MKKNIIVALLFGVFFTTSCFAQTSNIEGIYDNYQIVYSPKTKMFLSGSMLPDRVVLTKKTSDGTGSYSSYYFKNGDLALELSSNFEFIKNGRLIACDNSALKYYEILYRNGKFYAKKLSVRKLQKLFPSAQIAKLSKFRNNRYVLKTSNPELLIYNDTNKYFHKYDFTPETVKTSDIKGLINVKNVDKIIFSHYNEDTRLNPKYEIVK